MTATTPTAAELAAEIADEKARLARARWARYDQLIVKADRLTTFARALDEHARWLAAWALVFAGAAGLVGLRARQRREAAEANAWRGPPWPYDLLRSERSVPSTSTDG